MPDTFRIIVTGKGEYLANAGDTLLEAGQRAGFGFPSACRNGNCLRCQGALVHGSLTQRVGNLASNTRTVHAGDAGAARVLYCVAHALENCEITVPDITAPGELPVSDVSCQITALEALNHDVSRVMLRLPAGRKLRWQAGQYLMLDLPAGDSAFSIANACNGRELELHVRHNAENPSSLEVIDALRHDSLVRARLPFGERFIGDTLPDRPVWFICGSTGFAPAKAMIEHLLASGFQHPIHLYWGARTEADIYLPALPQQWATRHNVRYVPVLSESADTAYRSGLVHEAVLADLGDPAAPEFHIGGSPPMAWAVFDALAAAGVPAAQMHSDVFDYAPRG